MDMLVRLYDLPDLAPAIRKAEVNGVSIARAFPPNRNHIVSWVEEHSTPYAAGEAACCFGAGAPSIFIASRGDEIIGYACYNATAPDFFGPMKVLESEQGKGIGKALLLRSLWAMREEGYGYAVIGDVGPVEFYEKTVGAVAIEDSTPGLYSNMLRIRR